MHNEHDQFAKRILTEIYDQYGLVHSEKEVPSLDAQRMDLWYEADGDLPPEQELPSYLQLPMRMGRRAAHFEFQSTLPGSVGMRKIVRKQLTWDQHRRLEAERRGEPEPPLFPTWVILPGKPAAYFARRRARRAQGLPRGFYWTDEESELWFVVVSELPRTRQTLLLRLLGSERCREEAMADMRRIPDSDREHSRLQGLVAELRRAVECDKEIPEPERTHFMTQARAEHIRYTEEIERRGETKGETKGERTAVYDLCEVLKISVTRPRRQQVEKMGLDELRVLRQHLKQHQSWPKES